MTNADKPRILVTGGSGQLAQAVLHHLTETIDWPLSRLVVTSRSPEKLAALASRGIAVRAADFDDGASLQDALSGVDRALIISSDALDRPGRRLEQHQRAVKAAEAAGVSHAVYTSMPDPARSKVTFAGDHAGTEQALVESRLPGWTVLRNHWYFENLFMSLPQVLATGKWFTAAGEGRVADVARDDLARAAAVALTREVVGKDTFTLSGPRALTVDEIAPMVAKAVGRPIEVVHVPADGLIDGMVGAGVPRPIAEMWGSFDRNTAAGQVGEVTEDLQRLTGEAPMTFEAWLDANRNRLVAG